MSAEREDSREDFLARWSRRKLEMRRAAEEVSPPGPAQEILPQETEPQETEASGTKTGTAAPVEPELTAEEIAALPKIEDLTADSDIAVFLRKGVPEMLKNAALRRMWLLDPTIRDYVGEAREYAYDWNMPGGVPGNGPLLPSDDVEGMLRQIFGDRAAEPVAQAGGVPQVPPSQSRDARHVTEASHSASDSDAVQHEAEPASGEGPREIQEATQEITRETPAEQASLPSEPASGIRQEFAAPPLHAEPMPSPAPRPRRHGRARPV
jgi:Protein of unknown function (DUF3306)